MKGHPKKPIILLTGSRTREFPLVVSLPEQHKWSDHARVYYKVQRKAKKALINGKHYWMSSNGKHAIWFDKKFKNWKIGYEEHKGTSKCAIYSICTDTQVGSPAEIENNWACYHGETFHYSSADSALHYRDEAIQVTNFTGM